MSRLANHFQSEIYALLGLTVQFLIFFQTPTHSKIVQQGVLQRKTSHSKKFQYYSHNRSLVAKVCVRTVNSTKEFRADQLILKRCLSKHFKNKRVLCWSLHQSFVH